MIWDEFRLKMLCITMKRIYHDYPMLSFQPIERHSILLLNQIVSVMNLEVINVLDTFTDSSFVFALKSIKSQFICSYFLNSKYCSHSTVPIILFVNQTESVQFLRDPLPIINGIRSQIGFAFRIEKRITLRNSGMPHIL